ncbi:ULK/ULK protein kinase [Saprolegnia diclina VS20]|uniref:ULK/ULK protein kinase n=1 Tax=Saprolegnia diclina (strain VS20) TaxID=1156394 RepID=T0RSH5_SAPDV|nr:ULK/ULK protein kinase [Saprolegnia diclina VS20]EQC33117.1 ULK/ULK protein kinase [Saprolegnia diclina VS20]|eukprot:XP_008613240.1 ULK/ULK protein kinase [Saprolegnia diclina VS20]
MRKRIQPAKMENYNIYDEIGRGSHSVVYKARRKRSIEYVAVKSTGKGRKDKVHNEVLHLIKLESTFVLKFYNWYESSNHIWIIFEFCIGGDLLKLLAQDTALPETSLQTFGHDLVHGLHYVHSQGVLYCDLKPANVLVDEYGSLKLADFGLARRIPTVEALEKDPLAPGSPHYMAPELFEATPLHSFASDFWALGCVLYELRVGTQLFPHRDFNQLRHTIQTTHLTLPDAVDMSEPFKALLRRLLEPDPARRMTWSELVQHPFWDAVLELDTSALPAQDLFAAKYPSTAETTTMWAAPVEKAGRPPSPQLASPVKPPSDALVHSDEAVKVRPATAPEHGTDNQVSHDDAMPRHPSPPRTAPAMTRPMPMDKIELVALPTKAAHQRIYTTADCAVRPIVSCDEIEAVAVPRYKEASLPVRPAIAFDLPGELEAHLEQLYLFLRGDAGANDKHNALAYLCALVPAPKIANVVANSSLLTLLVKLLDRSTSSALSTRLGLVLGLIVRHAAFISTDALLSLDGLVPVLLRVLPSASEVLGRRATACLGELAFYLSTLPTTSFPSALVDALVSAVDAPDAITRHYATQAICNILVNASTASAVRDAFLKVSLLDAVYRRTSDIDALPLRVAAMHLASQLLKHTSSPDPFLDRTVLVLPSIWACVRVGDAALAVPSLNILNCVLAARPSLPVTSIVSVGDIALLLQKKELDLDADATSETLGRFQHSNARLRTLLQGKLLLLAYFGLQSSRDFALAFVAANLLDEVERCLHAAQTYVAHSAAQVVSLAGRIALELTFTLASSASPPSSVVDLFETLLGRQLLTLPRCRHQFMAMLRANEHEEFECFVLGSTELLKHPELQTCMVQLLVPVFATDDILLGTERDRLWFDSALVAVADLLLSAPDMPDTLVAAIRVLFSALNILPRAESRDVFVLQALLPAYRSLLTSGHHTVVLRFAIELLYDLVQQDASYVAILHRLELLPLLFRLLLQPATISASATQLVRRVVEAHDVVPTDVLYELDLPKTLAVCSAHCAANQLWSCASDIGQSMYSLLYAQYEAPNDARLLYAQSHAVLVEALPSLLAVCAADTGDEADAHEHASRCVSLLCQLFGAEASAMLLRKGLASFLSALRASSAPVLFRLLLGLKSLVSEHRVSLTKDPHWPHLIERVLGIGSEDQGRKSTLLAREVYHLMTAP